MHNRLAGVTAVAHVFGRRCLDCLQRKRGQADNKWPAVLGAS